MHPFLQSLSAGQSRRIVFYGTSLTAEGAWVPQLLAVLNERFPCLVASFNAAASGMHSRWGVENVGPRVLAHAPDVVFIEFSVNGRLRPLRHHRD